MENAFVMMQFSVVSFLSDNQNDGGEISDYFHYHVLAGYFFQVVLSVKLVSITSFQRPMLSSNVLFCLINSPNSNR